MSTSDLTRADATMPAPIPEIALSDADLAALRRAVAVLE
ncbi:EcsC family protein, partial [Methylobacterium sp. WL18]